MCSSIGQVVDALTGVDLAAAPDGVLEAEIVELRRQIERLEAEWLRWLEAFDRRGVALQDGTLSTAAWLRNRCRLAPAAASQAVAVARALADRLPETGEAFRAGEVSYRAAAVLTRATEQVAPAAVRAAEPHLLDAARRLHPGHLQQLTRHWRHLIDADVAQRDADVLYDGRQLFLSRTFGGMYAVNGMLDPETGAMVLAALQPLAAPRPDDSRTPAQRRADALGELARRRLDAGDLPDAGGEKPHLVVTVSLDTLEARAHNIGGDLEWVGAITGEAARRLACDAGVSRIITNGASEVLDIGRMTRVVPTALRRALVLRDGGCAFPTCDRPPPWCDAHHVAHWADGGPTALDNLVLLCRAHHRLLHEGRWQLTRGPDGRWSAIPFGRAERPAA